MPDSSDWASNANDAVRICLRHRKPHDRLNQVFHPAFTYPIFGDEEVIFGYRGLKVKLDFQPDTLDSTAAISWTDKYTPVGDTKAEDIEEKLQPVLFSREVVQGNATDTPTPQAIPAPSPPFIPPGERLHTYEVDGREYGIWSANLADPATKKLVRNLQIFILFHIEGGTFISLDDPDWTIQRWQVYFVYEILKPATDSPNKHPDYSFVGYSTTYRLYYLDNSKDSTATTTNWDANAETPLSAHLPSRVRISQFLILPPHQGCGHGTYLYTCIMTVLTSDATVREITVEDPNESFDDLRDLSDLSMLRTLPSFAALRLDTAVQLGTRSTPLPTKKLLPPATLDTARTTSKLATRQFARLVEMHLLSLIPAHHRTAARITRKDRATDPQDRAYYFWRLLVKQRLYKHNVDTLAQLDLEERIEKLDETLAGVEADYVRILDALDRRAAAAAEGRATDEAAVKKAPNGVSLVRRALKRKVLDDDDEAESEDDTASKKARVDDEDDDVNGGL